MQRVFLSYRRADTASVTRQLHHFLSTRFGQQSVFMDIETLIAGVDFREVLRKQIESCDIFIILIGREWTARINEPDDFIALEVGFAIDLQKLIIPVLIDDEKVPQASILPEKLEEITYRPFLRLRQSNFVEDAERLAGAIQSSSGKTPPVANAIHWLGKNKLFIGGLFLVAAIAVAISSLWQSILHSSIALYEAFLRRWRDVLSTANTLLSVLIATLVSMRAVGSGVQQQQILAKAPVSRDKMHRVFVCYRRDDAAYPASYIYEKLETALGAGSVFKDVDSIPYGTDFRTHVEKQLKNCQVCLVLIGKQWLSIKSDGDKLRLFEDGDHVRTEVETVPKAKYSSNTHFA